MNRAKKRDNLANMVKKLVTENGGILVSDTERMVSMTLNTDAGVWNISVPKEKSLVATIFTRFSDVERAVEVLGKDPCLNPHSGKFNFHLTKDEDCFNMFKREFLFLCNYKQVA